MRCLQNDTSFDRSVESDAYLDHAKELASVGFSVVIFGHTHLAKEVPLGHATYLNTGAWADLMRIPQEILSTSPDLATSHLEHFVNALKTGNFQPYVEFSPTFAHIVLNAQGKALSAELRDFEIGKVSGP